MRHRFVDSSNLPGSARSIESHVTRSRNAIAAGDSETALFHLRIAAEAWGRFAEQVDAVPEDDPIRRRLSAQVDRDGERLLALEGDFTEAFLREKAPRRGWWRRLFSAGSRDCR